MLRVSNPINAQHQQLLRKLTQHIANFNKIRQQAQTQLPEDLNQHLNGSQRSEFLRAIKEYNQHWFMYGLARFIVGFLYVITTPILGLGALLFKKLGLPFADIHLKRTRLALFQISHLIGDVGQPDDQCFAQQQPNAQYRALKCEPRMNSVGRHLECWSAELRESWQTMFNTFTECEKAGALQIQMSELNTSRAPAASPTLYDAKSPTHNAAPPAPPAPSTSSDHLTLPNTRNKMFRYSARGIAASHASVQAHQAPPPSMPQAPNSSMDFTLPSQLPIVLMQAASPALPKIVYVQDDSDDTEKEIEYRSPNKASLITTPPETLSSRQRSLKSPASGVGMFPSLTPGVSTMPTDRLSLPSTTQTGGLSSSLPESGQLVHTPSILNTGLNSSPL